MRNNYFVLASILLVSIFSVLFFQNCASRNQVAPATKARAEGAVASKSLSFGNPVPDASLSDPLQGKGLFLIGGGLNRSKCWQDSEFWDSETLWYALSSKNWT